MRDLSKYNQYQHLILSALALVHEEDLVAILRAARHRPERNRCIDVVNAELDKGLSLMETFADHGPLSVMFDNDFPEFRVGVWGEDGMSVDLDFGLTGRPSSIMTWSARMSGTGVVAEMEDGVPYFPEGLPSLPKNGPKGRSPFDEDRDSFLE